MLSAWANYLPNLGLNANLDEAANNGEHIANDEQEVPAVDELHPVSPAHTAPQPLSEELHTLLQTEG